MAGERVEKTSFDATRVCLIIGVLSTGWYGHGAENSARDGEVRTNTLVF